MGRASSSFIVFRFPLLVGLKKLRRENWGKSPHFQREREAFNKYFSDVYDGTHKENHQNSFGLEDYGVVLSRHLSNDDMVLSLNGLNGYLAARNLA